MSMAKTFDDIFDQLHSLYKGEWVQVQVKKDGLTVSNFSTYVSDLKICPLDERSFRRHLGLNRSEKLGSIVVFGSHTPGGKTGETLQIPFKLGFNTMIAHITRGCAEIETCGFDFALRKLTSREIRAISA